MVHPKTLTPFVLIIGGLSYIVLKYILRRIQSDNQVGNNPTFRQFQRRYFIVLIPAIFADWLQGPYLYALYRGYGYMEEQIAVIYAVGFMTNILTSAWSAKLVSRYERRRLALLALAVYAVASLLKISQSYSILLISRMLSGISTSVLFSAFDAWYGHMHIEQIDFPREWISLTAGKTAEYNAIMAIVAGLTSNLIVWSLPGFHEITPFVMSIPFLSISAVMILLHWTESCSTKRNDQSTSLLSALKEIMASRLLFLIGTLQALFESSMYVFIFVWTPIVADANYSTPFGLIFASFMTLTLLGSMTYKWLTIRYKTLPITLLAMAVVSCLIANICCVFIISLYNRKSLLYICFLVIEFSVGLYFPAISHIRERVMVQEKCNSSAIIYWFRVPVNLIACIVLIVLHGSKASYIAYNPDYGNMCIFISCSIFMAFASLAVAGIGSSMERNAEKELQSSETI